MYPTRWLCRAMKGDVHLQKRVLPRVRMGKARPAIFYQFDTLVELSDGAVVRRRSQAPKDEIRMLTDIRNLPLWNPSRLDLVLTDAAAAEKLNKFQKRMATFDGSGAEGIVDLMGENVQEVQKGGKLRDKKRR